MSLNKELEAFLIERGAMKVGFVTKETLEGGPPSTDLTYVLPEAESAIIFALPLDKEKIRAFLRKDLPNGFIDLQKNNNYARQNAFRLAKEAGALLENKGYKTYSVLPDWVGRTDIRKKSPLEILPNISFRALALRAGVGSLGWNGFVGMKGWGTAIVLCAVVTNAKLEPTDPIPPEDSFCTKCKICVKVCPFRTISNDEEDTFIVGGYDVTRGKRDIARCMIVCSNITGLEKDKKWSTWSPGRYEYPKDDNEVLRTLMRGAKASGPFGIKRPEPPDNYFKRYEFDKDIEERQMITKGDLYRRMNLPAKLGDIVRLSCGNCQLSCGKDAKETQENFELLINSGCVVQKEDGEIVILPPDEAEKLFDSLEENHKKLYY